MQLIYGIFSSPLRKYLLIPVFFIFSIGLWSSEGVKIDDSLSYISVNARTEYFSDSSGSLSFQEILKTTTGSFLPYTHDRYSMGLYNKVLWIRFKVEKRGEKDSLLAITKLMPFIDVYIPEIRGDGVEYRHLEAGNFNNTPRKFTYRYPVFPLPGNVSPDDYIYIRVQPFSRTDHVSLDFSIDLMSEQSFYVKAIVEIAVMFFLIGGLLALGLYNLFIALYLKIRVYVYYIAYIFSMILFIVIRSRILAIFQFYGVHLLVLPVIALAYVLSMVFSRSFLESKKNLPLLDKFMQSIIFLSPLILLFLLAGQPIVADIIIHLLTVAAPVVVITAGTIRFRQGYAPARFYLGSWVILGSAVLLSGIGTGGWGIIPSFIDLEFIMAVGAFGEALLLSLALADRINILELEKKYLSDREKYLSEISIRDELTGLFNKRMYQRSIQRNVETRRKNSIPLSLLIIDIDHFKSVNDEYGHSWGDKVLISLAETILSCLRTSDVACRYGGEEFAVILPGTSSQEALRIAERLREKFAGTPVVESSGKEIVRTISIGVSELLSEESAEELFERADRALYAAKTAGRNRVVLL